MNLVLWRHAEAHPGYPDSDRPLTAAGVRQAAATAQWLASRLPAQYQVIASPALRAQQTARALTAAFRTDNAVGTAASPDQILQTVAWPYGDETVIVVGHQPTLGAVAALALTGKTYGWAMATGALWWLAREEHGRETLLRAALAPDLL